MQEDGETKVYSLQKGPGYPFDDNAKETKIDWPTPKINSERLQENQKACLDSANLDKPKTNAQTNVQANVQAKAKKKKRGLPI